MNDDFLRKAAGLVLLITLGWGMSLLASERDDQLPNQERKLSLFEAVKGDGNGVLKMTNYSSVEDIYVVGLEMGIVNRTVSASRPLIQGGQVENESLAYGTTVSEELAEYLLFNAVKIGHEEEKKIRLFFREEAMAGESIFIKKVIYKKTPEAGGTFYEQEVDLVLPAVVRGN